MTREEKAAKAAKMLMLFNINDYGEGELNTWYRGIEKDMQEALNMAIEVLQEQILKETPSAQPFVLTCDGCRHVGTYDTDFPCSGCIRREKDYYEQER